MHWQLCRYCSRIHEMSDLSLRGLGFGIALTLNLLLLVSTFTLPCIKSGLFSDDSPLSSHSSRPSARSQQYVRFVPSFCKPRIHVNVFSDPEIGLQLPVTHVTKILMATRCKLNASAERYHSSTCACHGGDPRPSLPEGRPREW